MGQLSENYWVNTQMFHEQIFEKYLVQMWQLFKLKHQKLNNQLTVTKLCFILKSFAFF